MPTLGPAPVEAIRNGTWFGTRTEAPADARLGLRPHHPPTTSLGLLPAKVLLTWISLRVFQMPPPLLVIVPRSAKTPPAIPTAGFALIETPDVLPVTWLPVVIATGQPSSAAMPPPATRTPGASGCWRSDCLSRFDAWRANWTAFL